MHSFRSIPDSRLDQKFDKDGRPLFSLSLTGATGRGYGHFRASHAPSMVQRAGATALRDGEAFVRGMAADVQRRVRYCYEALAGVAGVTVAPPEGSFYLFPRIAGLSDSFAFARSLREQARMAVAPGSVFGRGGDRGGPNLLRGRRIGPGTGDGTILRISGESMTVSATRGKRLIRPGSRRRAWCSANESSPEAGKNSMAP